MSPNFKTSNGALRMRFRPRRGALWKGPFRAALGGVRARVPYLSHLRGPRSQDIRRRRRPAAGGVGVPMVVEVELEV